MDQTMYVILCGQDHMSYSDMAKECSTGKWLPILVMRTGEESTIVPVFESVNTAIGFIRRNLPKDWICGTVPLRMRDAEWMDEHHWKAIKFDFPRKLKDIVEFDVEILEYEKEHNVQIELRKAS